MSRASHRRATPQSGLTLIELIMFIVIVSVGIAGILSVLNLAASKSAHPMVRKQVLSVAEAMMEDILAKDYQNDPNDPGNASATLGCTPTTSPLCRVNTVADRGNYNDVSDYDGWNQTGVRDLDGTPVTGLEFYTVAVTVGAAALWNTVPAKLVTVTVSNGSETISLTGYRTNYD